MLGDLFVEFSEVSLASLQRVEPDPSRRESIKASLKFYLRRDATREAFPCEAFEDRSIFIYPFAGRFRVLFEIDERVLIWSVSRLVMAR